MSGRCKSCNTVLTEEEMCLKYPEGDYVEMCIRCMGLSEEGEEEFDVPEWSEGEDGHG